MKMTMHIIIKLPKNNDKNNHTCKQRGKKPKKKKKREALTISASLHHMERNKNNNHCELFSPEKDILQENRMTYLNCWGKKCQ